MDDLSSYIILPINAHLLPNIVSGTPISNESDNAATNDKVYTNIEYYMSPNSGIENVYVNTVNSNEMQSGHFISKDFVEDTINDMIYKCSSCEAKYNNYDHYLDHLQSHENKTSLQCKKCKKLFDTMSSYHKHIMNHQEDKLFRCSICHSGFNYENNFKIHMALHGTSLVCPICELTFQRMASLKSHLAIHQVEEFHTCSECSSEFENVTDLRKHIKTHTLDIIDQQNDLICNICKVKFETPISLKHHIASHLKVKKLVLNGKRNKTPMGNKEHKYRCAICNKTFPKISLLERHNRIHSGERPYVCSICDKGFTQKGTLQIHMTKHSGIKPFCCTLCPAKFNQKGNLKVHVQKTHTATTEDEKIFKCSQCDCIFKKVASLNGHMTKIHATDTGEISIASIIDYPKNINKRLIGNFPDSSNSIISQSTENKLELNVADKLPGGDKISKIYSLKQKFLGTSKVYICSYCDKEIKKPSDLIRHLRTHTKERPFKCFCGNSFSIKSTLLTHMQIHKGNIGKKCPKCSRVLSSQKAWNAHLRKHDTSLQTTILKSKNHQDFHETREQSPASFAKKVKRTQLHSGERKYKCRVCHRSFITPFSLKEHMKLHNEALKFECETCDEKFATKSLMKRHMSIHRTLKPYECFYCRKKFKNMLMCGRHIRTHENSDTKQDILRASISYAEDKVSTVQTTPNVSESTSLLAVNPNEILDNLFDSDKNITVEGDDVDVPDDVEKFAPSNTTTTLEFGKHEELQTFLVDCSTDVHEENGLPNHFFSHLDLQPSNIIDLDSVNDMQQSPIVFNVQNIVGEGEFPAVELMNNELYINNTSGPTDSQQPISLLRNVQKTMTSALSNLICIPNDISDNFLANNISLYPNTRIGFEKSSEINSTIPLNLITSQEDLCLKDTDNAENNTTEGVNVISVSFEESGGGTGNLNIIHCSACKKLFDNMESYESHSCLKSVLKKNNISESIDLEMSMKTAVDTLGNNNSSKSESKSQKPVKKNFSCVYCGKQFNSRGAYIRHANTHQRNVDGMHKCKFCIKKFKKPSDLSRHLRTHTGEKPFACDKCDKKFSLKSTLEGHYRTHNPGATKDFVCEICNSFFTSKSSLKIHMHVHTGIKPHKCNYCDQYFRTLAHRRSHEQKMHSNCSMANSQSKLKVSIDPSTLENVEEQGHNSELPEIGESTDIKMQFSDQGNQTLTDAIQIDDVLLQQLQNTNIIIEVLQDIDPKEQSSVITVDENTLGNLEIITTTNTQSNEQTADESIEIDSERNIECEICHKKYASKDVFRKHMQLHSKNKFICELCNKWFSTVEALCEHEKLHSGHRPYSCFLCTNNFAELQHMKSHLKRIHQIEDTNSPLILKMSIGDTGI